RLADDGARSGCDVDVGDADAADKPEDIRDRVGVDVRGLRDVGAGGGRYVDVADAVRHEPGELGDRVVVDLRALADMAADGEGQVGVGDAVGQPCVDAADAGHDVVVDGQRLRDRGLVFAGGVHVGDAVGQQGADDARHRVVVDAGGLADRR